MCFDTSCFSQHFLAYLTLLCGELKVLSCIPFLWGAVTFGLQETGMGIFHHFYRLNHYSRKIKERNNLLNQKVKIKSQKKHTDDIMIWELSLAIWTNPFLVQQMHEICTYLYSLNQIKTNKLFCVGRAALQITTKVWVCRCVCACVYMLLLRLRYPSRVKNIVEHFLLVRMRIFGVCVYMTVYVCVCACADDSE